MDVALEPRIAVNDDGDFLISWLEGETSYSGKKYSELYGTLFRNGIPDPGNSRKLLSTSPLSDPFNSDQIFSERDSIDILYDESNDLSYFPDPANGGFLVAWNDDEEVVGGDFEDQLGGYVDLDFPRTYSMQKIEIAQNNPSVIYGGTFGGGIFVTTNGGSQWRQKNDNLSFRLWEGAHNICAIEASATNPAIAYIAPNYGVFKTNDYGDWS
jgi:hypothetical protein